MTMTALELQSVNDEIPDGYDVDCYFENGEKLAVRCASYEAKKVFKEPDSDVMNKKMKELDFLYNR